MGRKTVIVFERDIAPALDMNDPLQCALRQSIMDPSRHPYVRMIGRIFGTVLNLKDIPKMSAEEVKACDAAVEAEMKSYFDGDYMDSQSARAGMKALYQKAFEAGQRSRNIE